MRDSLLTQVANWSGALLAAIGWAVSNWFVIVVAVVLVAGAAIVVRSLHAHRRPASGSVAWRERRHAPLTN